MTRLVGILNLTPDSFSDGGIWSDRKQIMAHCHEMMADGAAIIDVGAESTRPGATPLSAGEEWQRLADILPDLCRTFPISLDTRHAANAGKALECGAAWINDVSGLTSVEMVETVKSSDCKLVLMHSLSVPANPAITLPEDDAVSAIIEWGRERIAALDETGIRRERIIFDPGIGFGKTIKQSWHIVERAAEFKELEVPLLFGHSRKSFLSKITSHTASKRDEITFEVSKKLAADGIDYLRVHNLAIHKNL